MHDPPSIYFEMKISYNKGYKVESEFLNYYTEFSRTILSKVQNLRNDAKESCLSCFSRSKKIISEF